MFFSWLLDLIYLRSLSKDKEVENVPRMNKIIKAKVIDVYDGDTCKVIYRYGTKPIKISIRIQGIDTPEIKTPNKYEKEAAIKIRDLVRKKILGKILYIKLIKWDKYGGRVVGDVFLSGKKNNLSNFLLSKNLAKPYTGNKKDTWTDYECKKIISFFN